MELDDKIYDQITKLCDVGDNLADESDYDNAIKAYNRALELVPLPKEIWEASTWIYTAIGDAYFLDRHYNKALDNFFNAMKCPDGTSNPFINLRIGECFYELKNHDKAKEYLLCAYMLDGENVFSNEDSCYLNFIKEFL